MRLRTLTREDADAAADLTARIFSKEGEYESMFSILRLAYLECPFMPPELCFAGEVDGRLVAKWQILDFMTRIGRTEIKLAGIQAVVAEPDENHKGYPRKVAEYTIRALDALGFDLALGFAQRGAFYRRIGAVPLQAEYELELNAQQIPKLRDDPFHEWTEAELPQLIDHYNRANANRSGSLIRTEGHWPWMVRKAPVIYMCDDGYIGVRYYHDRLEIREVAGRGEAFHQAALGKLAQLALAAGQRKINGAVPADHPLALAAIPHGAKITADYTKKSGCIALPFSPLRMLAKIRPELEDRLGRSRFFEHRIELIVRCGGQEETFALASPGAASSSGEAPNHKVELDVSPGGALQLAFGYRPVRSVVHEDRERAAAHGVATSPLDDTSLEILDVLFPQGHPFMWQPDRY
jgi:hypothetical protein